LFFHGFYVSIIWPIYCFNPSTTQGLTAIFNKRNWNKAWNETTPAVILQCGTMLENEQIQPILTEDEKDMLPLALAPHKCTIIRSPAQTKSHIGFTGSTTLGRVREHL
jgi:hypothetical protein